MAIYKCFVVWNLSFIEAFSHSMYMCAYTHEYTYIYICTESFKRDMVKQNEANLPIKKMASDADFPNCCSKYLGMKDIMPMKALNCSTDITINSI